MTWPHPFVDRASEFKSEGRGLNSFEVQTTFYLYSTLRSVRLFAESGVRQGDPGAQLRYMLAVN